MRIHAQLTEGSLRAHSRKGREGKGREEDGSVTHCMTVTGGSDAASCNAIGAIEHLDFHPNCSSDEHERRALWICRVIERPCDCGPTVVLACGPCYAWYNPPGIWRWHCTDCDLPLALAWEPLC